MKASRFIGCHTIVLSVVFALMQIEVRTLTDAMLLARMILPSLARPVIVNEALINAAATAIGRKKMCKEKLCEKFRGRELWNTHVRKFLSAPMITPANQSQSASCWVTHLTYFGAISRPVLTVSIWRFKTY